MTQEMFYIPTLLKLGPRVHKCFFWQRGECAEVKNVSLPQAALGLTPLTQYRRQRQAGLGIQDQPGQQSEPELHSETMFLKQQSKFYGLNRKQFHPENLSGASQFSKVTTPKQRFHIPTSPLSRRQWSLSVPLKPSLPPKPFSLPWHVPRQSRRIYQCQDTMKTQSTGE